MPAGSLILLAFYGALLGARHALEPDHLATVSTMAAHGRSRVHVLGVSAAWGAGHASLIAAGSLIAMVAVAMLALWPVIWASSGTAGARRLVQGLAGVASMIVGVLLASGSL